MLLIIVVIVVIVIVPSSCDAFYSPATSLSSASRIRRGGSSNDDSSNTNNNNSSNNNNNVVFVPSTNMDAFDSYKIGHARVHRYTDPSTDAASYVMWYHGRSRRRSNSSNNNIHTLPPLSTGHIGRATSYNGLVWSRDTIGSVDTDQIGVSLGLNTDSWYGFDTSHVGLGQVLLPMTSPTIRSEGGVYVMYYFGGNYEQTDITSYIPNIPSNKEEKEDVTTTTANINNNDNKVSSLKLTGMKLRIGAAISQDGVTWGRIEGDDPSGACMVPYDKCDINNDDVSIAINEVTKMEYVIHEELYCGWPEVVVNNNNNPASSSSAASDTTKTRLDNYYMYYSTMLKESKQKVLACAISNNGFAFSKMGIILAPTTTTTADTAATTTNDDDSNNYDTTLDGGGCMRCNVINRRAVMMNDDDDDDDDSIRWVKKNKKDVDDAPSQWIMYYEGVSTVDGKHRILMAESDNLKEWKKIGLALDVGSSSSRSNNDDNDDAITTTSWDSKGVGSPHVIRLDDGTYRMYYTGEGMDGSTAIGVARSMDLQIWNRERVVELSSLLMK
jgi:hypothetical protein